MNSKTFYKLAGLAAIGAIAESKESHGPLALIRIDPVCYLELSAAGIPYRSVSQFLHGQVSGTGCQLGKEVGKG